MTCNGANVNNANYGWMMNYTPQMPIQSGQMILNAYGTSLPGLGYRMYMPDGTLIQPTSYGTNGGANFGPGYTFGGTVAQTPLTSTTSYQFKLDLVRTSTSLISGTFSDSLVRFGYQFFFNPNSGCPEGSTEPPCTSQFGPEITTPVVFHFVNLTCPR